MSSVDINRVNGVNHYVTSPTVGRSSSSSLIASNVPLSKVATVTSSSPDFTKKAGPSVPLTTANCVCLGYNVVILG